MWSITWAHFIIYFFRTRQILNSSYAIKIGAPNFDRVGSATSVMTTILASTRSTFFQRKSKRKIELHLS